MVAYQRGRGFAKCEHLEGFHTQQSRYRANVGCLGTRVCGQKRGDPLGLLLRKNHVLALQTVTVQMHATRGQVYMLNGSGNSTSVSRKNIHQRVLCPICHCHRQALVTKKQNHIAKETQAQRKASRRAFPSTEFNSAVFVCITKYIFTVKTPPISLPQKMELLFLHIGGVNIFRLRVTTRMQMYRFLNLIYRIMGSNNASLFYNEQSNSGV